MVFEQEAYVGDSKLSPVGAPTSTPTSSPPSEMVRVEVPRVAYAEESAPGTPVQEKMAEVPAPIGQQVPMCHRVSMAAARMGQSLGLKMHPSTTSARQLGASGDGGGGGGPGVAVFWGHARATTIEGDAEHC
jgi:hypothetical protein